MRLSGAQYDISVDGQHATIVEVGGGLRRYVAAGAEIVDGYAEDEIAPGSAGQVLTPWPNRIRDGKFTFGGSDYQLALSEAAAHNAIHGLTRWLRWSAVEQSASSVTVECDLVPQPGYPWPIRLRTTWSLSAAGLTADHAVTNQGDQPCPFGLGAHPYFRLDIPVDDAVLTMPAHSRLLTDGRQLPIGAAKVAGSGFDFTEGKRIGAVKLDTAFGDVIRDADGISTVRLADPAGAAIVDVWADRAFRWWQVYTGDTLPEERRRRSIAVEPMTCPADAFRSGRDVITIAPGDTWTGSWGIRPGSVA
jgi:aldose 1-epimerase